MSGGGNDGGSSHVFVWQLVDEQKSIVTLYKNKQAIDSRQQTDG